MSSLPPLSLEPTGHEKAQQPVAGKAGDKAPGTPQAVKYHLVVVFDERGFVERHALLRIR